MDFQIYTSEDFINGFNPATNVRRGRPRKKQAASNLSDVPVTSEPLPFPTPVTTNPHNNTVPAPASVSPTVPIVSASTEAVIEVNTSLDWDVPSTHVLIELFIDYVTRLGATDSSLAKDLLSKQTEDAFNANEAVNGRRDIAAMKTRWISLTSMYKLRCEATSIASSSPLPYWEFHEAMEQANANMPTIYLPVTYSVTDIHHGDHVRRRRRHFEEFVLGEYDFEEEDSEEDDFEDEQTDGLPQSNYLFLWSMMLNRMEENSRRERDLLAERNAFMRDQNAFIRDRNAFMRDQAVLNHQLDLQNAEMLNQATLAMTRMADFFVANINHARSSFPDTSTTNNNSRSLHPTDNNT